MALHALLAVALVLLEASLNVESFLPPTTRAPLRPHNDHIVSSHIHARSLNRPYTRLLESQKSSSKIEVESTTQLVTRLQKTREKEAFIRIFRKLFVSRQSISHLSKQSRGTVFDELHDRHLDFDFKDLSECLFLLCRIDVSKQEFAVINTIYWQAFAALELSSHVIHSFHVHEDMHKLTAEYEAFSLFIFSMIHISKNKFYQSFNKGRTPKGKVGGYMNSLPDNLRALLLSYTTTLLTNHHSISFAKQVGVMVE